MNESDSYNEDNQLDHQEQWIDDKRRGSSRHNKKYSSTSDYNDYLDDLSDNRRNHRRERSQDDFENDEKSSRRNHRRERTSSNFEDKSARNDSEGQHRRHQGRHHQSEKQKEIIREMRQKKAQELFENADNLENLSLQSFRSPFPNIHFCSIAIGRFVLIGTILLAPWLYGGATLFGQLILFCGILVSIAAALFMFLTSSTVDRQKHSFGKFGLTTIPLLLGLLLGIMQLIPFSTETLQTLAPRSFELRNDLILSDSISSQPENSKDSNAISDSQNNIAETKQNWDSLFLNENDQKSVAEWPLCLSIQPSKTREQLALLFMAIAAFMAGGILFNSPTSRRWLWMGITVNAFLLAIFSITMYLRPIGIYQRIWPNCQFGPYVNRNNLSGYLCICFGVVFGLWVEQLLAMRRRLEKENDAPVSSVYKRSLYYRLRDRFYQTLDLINRKTFFGAVVLGVLFAGILMLMSRGATLALFISFLLGTTILVVFRNFRQYILLLLMVVLIGVLTLFWLGRNESVSQRLETLTSLEAEENAFFQDVRLKTWTNALQTIKEYQWRGSGLGTFPIANRNHDQALAVNHIFFHAENQIIETLVEAGIIGTTLMILEFLTVLTICLLCLRKKRSDTTFAFGLGMFVVLSGQMIAGFADFGLYLMANALLLAVLCGSFVNQSSLKHNSNNSLELVDRGQRLRWIHFMMIFIFLALGISGSYWGIHEIAKAHQIEIALENNQLPTNPSQIANLNVDSLIDQLETATQNYDNSSDIHLRLANLYILKDHIIRTNDYLKNNPQSSRKNAWLQSDILLSLQNIFLFKRTKQEISANEQQQIYRDQGNVSQAIRHYLLARRICPVQPEIYCQLAHLLPLIQQENFEQMTSQIDLCLKRAEMISQYEPRIYYQNGLLFFLRGDETQAFACWQKSLNLSSLYMIPILNHLGSRIRPRNAVSIIDQIFPDSFELLNKCLNIFLSIKKDSSANIQSLLSKIPDPSKDSSVAIKSQYEIALSLLIQKKQDIIIDAILQKMEKGLTTISENDRDAIYYYHYGILTARQKKYNESATLFDQAIQLDSKQGRFYYEYARMLNEQDKLADAIEMYKKSLEYSPGHKLYIKRLEQAKARYDRKKFSFEPIEPITESTESENSTETIESDGSTETTEPANQPNETN